MKRSVLGALPRNSERVDYRVEEAVPVAQQLKAAETIRIAPKEPLGITRKKLMRL